MNLEKAVPVNNKRSFIKGLKRSWFFYLLALPGILHLILFWMLPLIGVRLAFSKYTLDGGLFFSEWVGLANFKVVLASPQYVLRALRNTLVLSLSGLFLGMGTQCLMAIMCAEVQNLKYRKLVQTITIFPNFLSWIVVGGISQSLLADDSTGIINRIIMFFGGEPIAWHMEAQYWWLILILFGLWKGFGYGSLIYFSTLMGVDPELYEAAQIDGAKRWQRIKSITVPALVPTIAISLLLGMGSVLASSVEQWIGMTSMNAGLLEQTDTLSTYIYRMGFVQGSYEMSAAIDLVKTMVGAILVLGANLVARKIDPDYALF